MELPVGDHKPVALAEDGAAEGGVFRDEADGGGGGGVSEGFEPEAVEEGTGFGEVVDVWEGVGCRG